MLYSETLCNYNPLNDPDYMSDQMLNHFKNKLQKMHKEILETQESISFNLNGEPNREPDPVDQGINEELHIQVFMHQEHQDQLCHEIELALERINDGIYGYCEETGRPIGIRRLLVAPYARYCLKVQMDKERERT